MKLKQRFVTGIFCLMLAISQTGCLGGIFFWPLWIPGVVVTAAGIAVTTVGGAYYHYPIGYYGGGYYGGGGALILVGLFLDKENPDYSTSLNELPMSESLAKTMNVSIADLQHYNQDLLKIREVGQEMTTDVVELKNDPDVVSAAFHGKDQLAQNEKVNRFAQKYGFESGEALIKGQHSKSKILPRENLNAFARAVGLEDSDAKILLYTGFGIQTE